MEARLKEIKKIKPTCPVGNINALHLKNVNANIVTSVVIFFTPLLSITWCRKMGGKNAPGGLQTPLCMLYVGL